MTRPRIIGEAIALPGAGYFVRKVHLTSEPGPAKGSGERNPVRAWLGVMSRARIR